MHTTTTRCDRILTLIDDCLAQYESDKPLRVPTRTGGDRPQLRRPGSDRLRLVSRRD